MLWDYLLYTILGITLIDEGIRWIRWKRRHKHDRSDRSYLTRDNGRDKSVPYTVGKGIESLGKAVEKVGKVLEDL